MLVATVAGVPVGYGVAHRMALPGLPDGWYLGGVVVTPTHRRQGIAARLTRARLDWIAARLGMPAPPDLPGAATISGKRLRNDLSRSLGWRPRYASYRDGYTSELPGNTSP